MKRSAAASARWDLGFSRNAVAAALRVHPITLAKWETGEVSPRLVDIYLWADVTGISRNRAARIFRGDVSKRTTRKIPPQAQKKVADNP